MRHLKQTHWLKFSLGLTLSLSLCALAACQSAQPLQTNPQQQNLSQLNNQPQVANTHASNTWTGGTLKLVQDAKGSRFVIQLAGQAKAGFGIQSVNCDAISAIDLEVSGVGLIKGPPTSALPAATNPCQFETAALPTVPSGKARILKAVAQKSGGGMTGELKTVFDAVNGQTSEVELSYRTTALASVIEELMLLSPPRGTLYATRLNLNALQDWLDQLTGVGQTEQFPHYSYTLHPLLLKADVLAEAIFNNQGLIPTTPPNGYHDLNASLTLHLTGIDPSKPLSVWVQDPATTRQHFATPSTNQTVVFDNIVPGTWDVVVSQDTVLEDPSFSFSSGSGVIDNYFLGYTPPAPEGFWSRSSGPDAGVINALDKDSAGQVYAATGGGVYRTNSYGENWQAANEGLPLQKVRLLAASKSGQKVYAILADHSLYVRDFSGGDDWQPLTSTTPTYVESMIYIDPDDQNHVFIGTNDGVLFECLNTESEPATWTDISSGLPLNTMITDMFKYVDPYPAPPDNSQYFLTTHSGVYSVPLGGSGWTAQNAGISGDDDINTIHYNSIAEKLQIGANDGKFYSSSLPTPNWIPVAGSTSPILDLVQRPDNPHKIYLATLGNALRGALDQDGSFDGVPDDAFFNVEGTGSGPLPPKAPQNPNLTSIVLDSINHPLVGTMGAGVNYFNGSNDWESRSYGLRAAEVQALASSPTGSAIFAGLKGGGLSRSENGVGAWTPLLNAGNNGSERDVTSMVTFPSGSNYDLFMGTLGSGVYVMNDVNDGSSAEQAWNQLEGLPDPNVKAMMMTSDGDLLVATPTGLYVSFCPGSHSCGEGASWYQEADGLGTDDPDNLVSLGHLPGVNLHLYAGAANGIFYSAADGDEWVAQTLGQDDQRVYVATLPEATGNVALDDRVYAGLSVGFSNPSRMYVSYDAGVNFEASSDLPAGVSINALLVSPDDVNKVYAATTNGVYLTQNAGASWSELNDGSESLDGVNVTSLHLKGSTLYAGTSGYSVYYMSLP